METKLEKLMSMFITESDGSPKDEVKDEAPDENTEKQNIMVVMAKFISDLDDDLLDDESYERIDIAFEAMFDVIVSLDEEDLDDESDEDFLELMDAFDELETVDVDEAYKYKAKKVGHGKRRSAKGRLTGSDKRKYIKKLKANRKVYRKSASVRIKAKKTKKKYNRSAAGKQTKRIYKSMNK